MKTIVTVIAVLALLTGGGALALAAGGGTPTQSNAGYFQYNQKPGCGPDKTEGDAGNSGHHDGQPPKEGERKDCPNPPGQQK